ncbi:hypothetical protein VTJ04DRAFT_10831 [Mycothermus thermophilus]|uniref:uncharacterized protein n=1 Tax=Humicola insolens TaxID=85995 RepID=UPI003742F6D0
MPRKRPAPDNYDPFSDGEDAQPQRPAVKRRWAAISASGNIETRYKKDLFLFQYILDLKAPRTYEFISTCRFPYSPEPEPSHASEERSGISSDAAEKPPQM